MTKKQKIKSKKENKKIMIKLFGSPLIISLIITFLIHLFRNLTFIFGFIIFILIYLILFIIFEYVINKDYSRYRDNVDIMFRLFTILVLMGQLLVFVSQYNVMVLQTNTLENQNEIIKESSISNRPEIVLWSSQGQRSYPLSNIVNGSKRIIAMGITNVGKTLVPSATIKIDRNSNFVGYLRDFAEGRITNPNWEIKNLNSLSYNTTFFSFKINPELWKTFEVGEKELKFRIDCPICKEPIDEQSIKICVYNKNITAECGSKWIQ